MTDVVSIDAIDKYDLWEPSDTEIWRELLQEAEMRSTCSHCGETRLGPAKEVKQWFKDHALAEHQITVTGGKLGKRKMNRLAWEPLTVEQKQQAYLAREFGVNPTSHHTDEELAAKRERGQAAVKWSRESLLAWRDAYRLEHGRSPACDMRGGPSWTPVKRVFGSWTKYMEAS